MHFKRTGGRKNIKHFPALRIMRALYYIEYGVTRKAKGKLKKFVCYLQFFSFNLRYQLIEVE